MGNPAVGNVDDKISPATAGSTAQRQNVGIVQRLQYRRHGGIHLTAIGDQDGLLLYSEDIDRHNTLARLATEALVKRISLQDKNWSPLGRFAPKWPPKRRDSALIG